MTVHELIDSLRTALGQHAATRADIQVSNRTKVIYADNQTAASTAIIVDIEGHDRPALVVDCERTVVRNGFASPWLHLGATHAWIGKASGEIGSYGHTGEPARCCGRSPLLPDFVCP